MAYKDIEKRKRTLKIYYSNNKEKLLLAQKETRKRRRLKVITHYGGICACCGESRYEFLGIDHINGGGVQHRKSLPGVNIDRWLIKNNFPEGYRVLCHNCNMSLGLYGYCPHNQSIV
jgi:hypothetical protein